MNYINEISKVIYIIFEDKYLILICFLIILLRSSLLGMVERADVDEYASWFIANIITIFNLCFVIRMGKNLNLSDFFVIVGGYLMIVVIIEITRYIQFIIDRKKIKTLTKKKDGRYQYNWDYVECEIIDDKEIKIYESNDAEIVCYSKPSNLLGKIIKQNTCEEETVYEFKIISKVKYKFL